MLPLAEYAEAAGKSLRTVQRWIADGLLEEARQGEDGRWWVPADARPDTRRRTTSQPVAVPDLPAPAPAPLGVSGTVEDAAAALGVSPRGLRRLYADMVETPGLPMYVGRYGPHGALRVVVPPK